MSQSEEKSQSLSENVYYHSNQYQDFDLSDFKCKCTKAVEFIKQEEKKIEEKYVHLENRRKSVSQRKFKTEQESFDKLQTVNSTNLKSQIVELNIGGKNIDVRRQTLTAIPDSKLASMFSGRWDYILTRDKNNRFFFDFDPEWFEKLLDYLRELNLSTSNELIPYPDILGEHKEGFKAILEIFGIKNEQPVRSNLLSDSSLTISTQNLFTKDIDFKYEHKGLNKFNNSKIVQNENWKIIILKWLEEISPGSSIETKLLFDHEGDNLKCKKFKQSCKTKNETITFIQSANGYIFGGYSDVPLDQSGWKQSSKSFIFSLKNPSQQAPSKFSLKSVPCLHAIKSQVDVIIVFGEGDVQIQGQGKAGKGGQTKLGKTYENPSGNAKYLCGSETFRIYAIETFEIIRTNLLGTQSSTLIQTHPSSAPTQTQPFGASIQNFRISTQIPGALTLVSPASTQTYVPSIQTPLTSIKTQVPSIETPPTSTQALHIQTQVQAQTPSNTTPIKLNISTTPKGKKKNRNLNPIKSFLKLCDETHQKLNSLNKELELKEQLILEEIEFMNNFSQKNEIKDEILNFNVSGTMISVKQSTLNQYPNSVLATEFGSNKWKTKLEDLDKNGNIFLDVDPYCFQILINFLRLKKILPKNKTIKLPIVRRDKQQTFQKLMQYFGLAEVFVSTQVK